MMMAPVRGPEPGRLLARALLAMVSGDALVVAHHRTPWFSATFTGTRHHLVLHCSDRDAAARCAATMSEFDFTLRGHLVAEIVARADKGTLIVEALTLVEA